MFLWFSLRSVPANRVLNWIIFVWLILVRRLIWICFSFTRNCFASIWSLFAHHYSVQWPFYRHIIHGEVFLFRFFPLSISVAHVRSHIHLFFQSEISFQFTVTYAILLLRQQPQLNRTRRWIHHRKTIIRNKSSSSLSLGISVHFQPFVFLIHFAFQFTISQVNFECKNKINWITKRNEKMRRNCTVLRRPQLLVPLTDSILCAHTKTKNSSKYFARDETQECSTGRNWKQMENSLNNF